MRVAASLEHAYTLRQAVVADSTLRQAVVADSGPAAGQTGSLASLWGPDMDMWGYSRQCLWKFATIRSIDIDPQIGLLLQGHLNNGHPIYGNSQRLREGIQALSWGIILPLKGPWSRTRF